MSEELISSFHKACNFVSCNSTTFSDNILIQLYAFFKQATIGDCNISPPAWFNFEAKTKYNAWKSLKSMEKEEAMKQYVKCLDSVIDNWSTQESEQKGWVSVSSMRNTDEYIPDDKKTIFDWVKDGDVMKIEQLSFNADCQDKDGLTPLHWAADRGDLKIVKYLVNAKAAKLNILDDEGQTPLHYAVACGHPDVVKFLIEAGADTEVVDKDNLKARDLAEDAEILDLFL